MLFRKGVKVGILRLESGHFTTGPIKMEIPMGCPRGHHVFFWVGAHHCEKDQVVVVVVVVVVTWLLGYLVTWLLGYLVTWLLGYLVTWLLGYLVTWLLGSSWFYLVHLGSSWFILVHLGSSWFILVHLGSSWFILVHLGSSWFNLVHLGSSWFMFRRFSSHTTESRHVTDPGLDCGSMITIWVCRLSENKVPQNPI